MSWSASLKEPILLKDLTMDSFTFTPQTGNGAQESSEQFERAFHAAGDLLDTGALGGDDKKFVVSLAGHANEGHEPVQGWANDYISISITQAP